MKQETMKKLDNFWFYYKWHVIIGFIATIILIVTIHDAVTRVEPDISIDCILDAGITYGNTEILASDLEASGTVNDNNDDGKIKCQFTLAQTGRDPSAASADGSMMQVVQLRMAVGESSLIMTEPYILDLYEDYEIFGDLTAIADEMNIPEDRRYMSSDKTKVNAIKIDDAEFLSKNGIKTKDCYVSLRILNINQEKDKEKNKQFENAKNIIKYIIK